jgi:alpha-beta hydrolase superfamily lysophospholipase
VAPRARYVRWLAGTIAALALAAGLSIAAGSLLVARYHRYVRPAPAYLHPQTIELNSASGARLTAWVMAPPVRRGAVVVLHGVHANRSDMLGRAELLWRNGYAVLVPDFQAHGESTGTRVTFGYLESRDAASAVRYLRRRYPTLPVAAIGVSMGGAALALAAHDAQPDAAVLEAVYPSITEALDNRIAHRAGLLSHVLTPLLLLQLEPRLGIGPDDLRPIDGIKSLHAPVLIISGAADWHTTASQTQALYAAANEPKELWLVPGARHVDLLRYDPSAYAEHVLGFLDRSITVRASPAAPLLP